MKRGYQASKIKRNVSLNLFFIYFFMYIRMCPFCFNYYFSEQKIMTIINFYHDLQKTPTKMPFSVTIVHKLSCQAYLEQESFNDILTDCI